MSEYVVVDTETTGLDPDHDEIVEVAAAVYDTETCVFGEPVLLCSYTSLANPGRPIPAEASAVHLLTDRDVADAPSAPAVRAEVAAFVGDRPVVAHNAPFDRGFLPELESNPWIDTYRLARHLYPQAPAFKNAVLRFWLGLDRDAFRVVAPHRASGDALVTAAIFARQRADCAALGHVTLAEVLAFTDSPLAVERFDYGRKHRGAMIYDIPRDYLRWCLEDAGRDEPYMRIDPDTLAAIVAVLEFEAAA